MKLLEKVKNKIRFILETNSFISPLYYHFFYQGMKGKSLQAEIQKLAHFVDLRIENNETIPKGALKKLDYLFDVAFKNKMLLDEAFMWCMKICLKGRYGLNEPDVIPDGGKEGISTNKESFETLNQIIKGRRSVRKWENKSLDEDTIKIIIEIAKWAPASCNRQLWRVLIISKQNEKDFVGQFFPNSFYKKAPALLIFLMDTESYNENEMHFTYLDGAAFIQNTLLLFHCIGLGACWIGFKGWDCYGNTFIEKEKIDEFYDFFKLSRFLVPISMVAVGTPACQAKPPMKQGLQSILIKRGDGSNSPGSII